MLTENDLKAISTAESLIRQDTCTKVDLGTGMIIYKIPSPKPNKYVIRLDIKVEE